MNTQVSGHVIYYLKKYKVQFFSAPQLFVPKASPSHVSTHVAVLLIGIKFHLLLVKVASVIKIKFNFKFVSS